MGMSNEGNLHLLFSQIEKLLKRREVSVSSFIWENYLGNEFRKLQHDRMQIV